MLGPLQGKQLLTNLLSCSSCYVAACPRPGSVVRKKAGHSASTHLEAGVRPVPSHQLAPRSVRCYLRRANETPEQAQRRRLRESEQVEQRVHDIETIQDWKSALQNAGSKLVVIEVRR